ncbi:hypothetical protein EDEG_01328 [Edhazardia aedis USNM 41457]|uniref:Uncharacterized protein n=1 Tax=Edhazardia aedis (strain USNM 41457) TaxID=1003232 RepID=J8ZXP0_EDHAE|nr:hypothetical protein EDEG_01328 [Edhazardia aedis USNM 41457]|eukprot:EJW04458.1 hypothetical protein EDEG_01328 [Edhazardia aedis USNM 41457]
MASTIEKNLSTTVGHIFHRFNTLKNNLFSINPINHFFCVNNPTLVFYHVFYIIKKWIIFEKNFEFYAFLSRILFSRKIKSIYKQFKFYEVFFCAHLFFAGQISILYMFLASKTDFSYSVKIIFKRTIINISIHI